jgi:hypothetical protein
MTILLALLLSAQEGACDLVHGVGCIVRSTKCDGCGKEAVQEGKLCAPCARARKACSMCARVKRVHSALAVVEAADEGVTLLATTDPYAEDVADIRKRGFAIPKREDGRVGLRPFDLPGAVKPGTKVYVRFAKIDLAGGPPGKFESALAQRRIRVESVVPLDAALVVAPKAGARARILEGSEALETEDVRPGFELRLPPVEGDLFVELLDAEGKASSRKGPFRFKDGRWTLDGRDVATSLSIP